MSNTNYRHLVYIILISQSHRDLTEIRNTMSSPLNGLRHCFKIYLVQKRKSPVNLLFCTRPIFFAFLFSPCGTVQLELKTRSLICLIRSICLICLIFLCFICLTGLIPLIIRLDRHEIQDLLESFDLLILVDLL